jgi:hypothetical protein
MMVVNGWWGYCWITPQTGFFNLGVPLWGRKCFELAVCPAHHRESRKDGLPCVRFGIVRKQHHPGVYFSISMLGWFMEAEYYDGRHWDQERDTWEQMYYLEDRLSEDDCFLLDCLWQETTGLPMRVWSSCVPTFSFPILRVQATHEEKSDIARCIGVTIGHGESVLVCKTILVETEMGVTLAGKSQETIWPEDPLYPGIALEEKDLRMVRKFVRRNRAALLEHWKGDTTTDEFLSKIRKT